VEGEVHGMRREDQGVSRDHTLILVLTWAKRGNDNLCATRALTL